MARCRCVETHHILALRFRRTALRFELEVVRCALGCRFLISTRCVSPLLYEDSATWGQIIFVSAAAVRRLTCRRGDCGRTAIRPLNHGSIGDLQSLPGLARRLRRPTYD